MTAKGYKAQVEEEGNELTGLSRLNSLAQSVAEPLELAFSRTTFPEDIVGEGGKELDKLDRGYAWQILVGSACSLMIAFWFVNGYGIFQTYYEQNFTDSSASAINFVGAFCAFLAESSGIILSVFTAYFSARKLMLVYVLILLLGLIVLSLQHDKLYKIIIIQGLIMGISSGGIFNLVFILLGQWFYKRRAMAFGIAYGFSSFSATIWPLILPTLFQKIGFGWSMRTAALICLFIALFSIAFAKFRPFVYGTKCKKKEIHKVSTDQSSPDIYTASESSNKKELANYTGKNVEIKYFSWAVYKDTKFLILCLAYLVGSFALLGPYYYLPSYAMMIGVSSSLSYRLVSIINGSSLLGRFFLTFLADRYGRLNALIIVTTGMAMTQVMWRFLKDEVGVILFSIFYGSMSGTYMAISPASFTDLVTHDYLAQKIGFFSFAGGIGLLLGGPLGGLFIQSNNHTSYWKLAYLASSFQFLDITIYIAIKFYYAKGRNTA